MAIGGAVLLASTLGVTATMRHAIDLLWHAESGRMAQTAGIGEDLEPEALKEAILALLNDPDALPGPAEGIAAARYEFDGCHLVFTVARPPGSCSSEDEENYVQGYEERVDMRNLVTGPAYIGLTPPFDPPSGDGPPLAGLSLPWVPTVRVALDKEVTNYLLADPPTIHRGTSEERKALAADISERIEAGEIGPLTVGNHRRLLTCDGTWLVEPFRGPSIQLRGLLDARRRLVGLLNALEERVCPQRGWLLDW